MASFTLAVALATSVQVAPAATGLEVVARTTESSGRTKVTTLFTVIGDLRNRQTRFVYVPKNVCDGIAVSTNEPPRAMYGWRVFVGPVTYAPGSKARVRADVLLTTQRMWNVSGTAGDEPLLTALPTQASERSAVIDTLSGLRPDGACRATGLALEARLLPETPAQRSIEKVIEAELWFVHRAPDGNESSQRQVVRMRDGGRGDFYFDDLHLTAGRDAHTIPIAVEVFGTILTGTMGSDGDVHMTLNLTRRYVNEQTAFGVWPKTGKTEYPTTVKTGEVVSFLLPPLADDGGILLGHRFSLRLRIKPVGND